MEQAPLRRPRATELPPPGGNFFKGTSSIDYEGVWGTRVGTESLEEGGLRKSSDDT